jgi:putative DNA primase/helicase
MNLLDLEELLKEPEPTRLLSLAPAVVRPVTLDAAENLEGFTKELLRHAPAIEGSNGDHQTMRVGMLAHDWAVTPEAALPIVLAVYNPRCQPPWDEAELFRKIQSGFNSAQGTLGNRLTDRTARLYARTDLGLAERFRDQHGATVRWCVERGVWFQYDGKRWAADLGGATAMTLATQTVRALYLEASRLSDADQRAALVAHATASESRRSLDAMLALARSMLTISITVFDQTPDLLNVENGTLCLLTGELRAHDAADLIARVAPVAYDPTASAPSWEAFLVRILPSEGLRRFVQKAIGYSLTDYVTEQVLFFLYGQGANGKSTLITTIQRVLGEYACQAPGELLLSRRSGEPHPTELTALLGARSAFCSEVEDGRRFDEPRVKALTGGDKISARYLYGPAFDYWPTAKLWIAANHKPSVRGQDEGIWRRFRLVSFDQTIPEAERDPHLSTKLASELPGILRWAVEGALLWRKEGLQQPQEIRSATEGYRAAEDFVASFVEERCVAKGGAWTSSDALHNAYTHWARASDEPTLAKRKLGERLRKMGFLDQKKAGSRGWVGIELIQQPVGGPQAATPPPLPPTLTVPARKETLGKTAFDASTRPLAEPENTIGDEECE